MRKAIGLLLFPLLTGAISMAQSWNPYLNQGIIGKAPLLPMEYDGQGVVSFNIGNTGSSALEYDRSNSANNLSVEIMLSEGVPSKPQVRASIGGSWASYFDWEYDAVARKVWGVQKRTIPGDSQGNITLEYKVEKNTQMTVATNGFRAKLNLPAYIKGINTTEDDAVSCFTFVRATDFGDAPASYGNARHEINLFRDEESGGYTKYIMLGKMVDHEEVANHSSNGNGDKHDDGVKIPALLTGTTVTIEITVTAVDESYGFLNAWFDWNGDGDFLDPGERVTATPMSIFESGSYTLKVKVPEDAITTRPTFARFRIGANSGPSANNSWGEVEDYMVHIRKNNLNLITRQENVKKNGAATGSVDLTVNGGQAPYQFAWSNGATTEDLTGLTAGTYTVVVTDANLQSERTSVTITEPAPAAVVKPNVVMLTSQRNGLHVKLRWEMPFEHETEWFVIERSTDGGEFEPIGPRMKAAGNSIRTQTYTYDDRNVQNEVAIYRIRLIQQNGKPLYSNTTTERYDPFTAESIVAYPNPVVDRFLVTIDAEGTYQLDIISNLGVPVYRNTMDVGPGGKGTLWINRGNLAPGQYYLRVTHKGNNKTHTIKLMITHH